MKKFKATLDKSMTPITTAIDLTNTGGTQGFTITSDVPEIIYEPFCPNITFKIK